MKMKHIYIIQLVVLVLLISGCENYFDRSEIQLITKDKVTETPKLEAIESMVKSSYNTFGFTANVIQNGTSNAWDDGYGFRPDYICEDIAGGDMQVAWDETSEMYSWRQVQQLTFNASTKVFKGLWAYQFESISRANLALSYLEDPVVVDPLNIAPTLLNRYIGEMLFIRAYSYFYLVINFGGVPILTKPLESFEEAYSSAERATVDKVWEQIEADLTRALTLLPAGKYSSSSEPWRVSKGATLALLAKSALYQEKYDEVITYAGQIKTIGFELNTDWFKAFSTSDEFTDNEVIFQYDHYPRVSPIDPWNGNLIPQFYAWGFFGATQSLIDAFESNDPRKDYTVDPVARRLWKTMGATDDQYYGNSDSPINRILFRYADIRLWVAESYIMKNQVKEGVEIINEIRKRARNTATISGTPVPVGTLADRDINTNKEQAMKWLQHERRVELAFESCRWSDIRRWDIGKDVLGSAYQPHFKLYPIPQIEIDRTGGIIKQNPGY